ncbi:MAG TPA: ATP synthase subunit I [Halomonas sp.]|nr:ATP synthase subunit I [Halomonas sp.]
MARRIRRPTVRLVLLVQLVSFVIAALAGLLIGGLADAKAAMLGSAVALLPNLYFSWQVLRLESGRNARRIMSGFYRAEAGKFSLTVALFALVFAAVPLSNHALFFGAYAVTLCAYWLAPWLNRRRSPN